MIIREELYSLVEGPTKFDPKKDPSYPSMYGSPYDPNEALGGGYNAVGVAGTANTGGGGGGGGSSQSGGAGGSGIVIIRYEI